MTYYSLVKAIQTACENHKQVQSYGYGNLSNIETPLVHEDRRYPYVFLNPTQHAMQEGTILYRFNMIVMEMAQTDSDVLAVQSDCQQYIDDILAQLRFGYTDQIDLTLNVTLTPFKERFQDTVAGMTATLEVVVPSPLNQCIAPFN